jgi:hypothetical protein
MDGLPGQQGPRDRFLKICLVVQWIFCGLEIKKCQKNKSSVFS